MKKIVVIGGGFAGCAAAIAAVKAGAEVTLLERTDLLLGLGNAGGIMRNNGRLTAAEENAAMGAGELFEITDRYALHRNVDFPGHRHGSFFDIVKVEPAVGRLLKKLGVHVKMEARVTDVEMEGAGIKAVVTASGERLEADAFVEATGSAGPMGNCVAYGRGCSMCVLRCPAFGPRVSISRKAGMEDLMAVRGDGMPGAFSGSGKLEIKSLSEDLQKQLKEKGWAAVPLPEEMIVREKLNQKVCRQYALDPYAENIVLIDTGHAKIMTPYFPLEKLRQVDGFHNARYVDPCAGGRANSIRFMSMAERDNTMKVKGVENLFCGGEKAGPFVGQTEAIATGSLAGRNSAAYTEGAEALVLPRETATGDLIAYVNNRMEEADGPEGRYTFAGAEYLERMEKMGLYVTDRRQIREKIFRLGLENIYNRVV